MYFIVYCLSFSIYNCQITLEENYQPFFKASWKKNLKLLKTKKYILRSLQRNQAIDPL